MKKRGLRVLTLFLAILLCFTFMPSTRVWAQTEEERLEEEAMKNANSAAVAAEQKAGERRVKATQEEAAPQRRTTPKYKVVNSDK